jgi:methionyl-tRNA synthetase
MLAMVRCEEIMNESYAYFVTELAALKTPHNQSQLIEHFGANAAKIIDVALERYDNQAQRYHEETNKKKRAMLLEKMSADLLSIFNNQMKMSVALVQKKFNKNVKKELKEKEPTRNFLEIIERIRGEISAVFDESVKGT